MKRGVLIIIFFVPLVLLLLFFAEYFYPQIRPALGPPVADVSQLLKNENLNESDQQAGSTLESREGEMKETKSGPFTILGDFQIDVFANGFNKPRVLLFDKRGNLLVSDTGGGRVYAIEKNGNKMALAENLNNPHGLDIKDDYLYIAETDKVSRYNYDAGNLKLGDKEVLFNLPAGGGHYTRTVKFGPDGNLYVAVGSSCNICYEDDERRAVILKYDPKDWSYEIFAQGLRNTVFFVFNPKTSQIWGLDMGRDWLGDYLPPEELNIIVEDRDYGWPFCYGNKVHDTDFDENGNNPCLDTEPPIYELPAHFAPLGLTFIDSPIFPSDWQGDLLVALHGSWNRSTPGGYKVAHLDVEGNQVLSHQDFMTGFLSDDGVIGRPVDLVFGPDGKLFLSDDKAGVIYKISK